MASLLAATLFLVASHAVPSAPGVRERLMDRLGRAGFFAGYGLLSTVALALVIVAHRAAGPGPVLYVPPPGAGIAAVLLMPLAVFLVLARLTTRPGPEPHGIYRLSAVPGSTGVLLWATLHLANLGTLRQIIPFSGMAVIALVSLVRHLRIAPAACARVGGVPGLAAIRGEVPVSWREIGVFRPLCAVVIWAVLLRLHPVVIGPDPWAAIGIG